MIDWRNAVLLGAALYSTLASVTFSIRRDGVQAWLWSLMAQVLLVLGLAL